jgi:MFS family permease
MLRAAAISLAVGLVLADSSIAVLALPAIYREYDVSLGNLHWVLTSFNLVLALAAIPAALLTRRVAPRRSFAGGLVLFALAAAGCALAPSFGALVAFRAVQALGGAAAVVAALELLPGRRAVAWWVAAGVAGAAVGPAVGGVLTEAVSWQAVFAVQVPLALVPLPFLVGAWHREVVPGTASRPRLAPNVALAFLSAALAAALFLVVLLLIEGWQLSPLGAAAVVSALPFAALAAAPFARRVENARARATGGAILVAGGLAGLALLPRAGWAWTVPPQLLIGAGIALALEGLTETAFAGRRLGALDAGVTIAARHAGIVLGLLLLTPVLVGDLARERHSAELAATARLLDAQVSTTTKVELARKLSAQMEGTRGRIPEFAPAFRSVDSKPGERPALVQLQTSFENLLDRAVTSSFSRAFLLAAAFALCALASLAVRRREVT